MKELALFGSLLKDDPDVVIVSFTTNPFLREQTQHEVLPMILLNVYILMLTLNGVGDYH